jgi:hypothetical protein
MVGVLGRYPERGWSYSRLGSRVGWGSEVLSEQVQLNFSFPYKCIIVLLCGLLVDNNTHLKMYVFKMSYWLY